MVLLLDVWLLTPLAVGITLSSLMIGNMYLGRISYRLLNQGAHQHFDQEIFFAIERW